MLIISGSAEFIGETNQFTKGDSHAFTMFCSNENLDDQLPDIERFFNHLNWDQILIEEAGIVDNDEALNNSTLKQAFNKANKEHLSVVMQNSPLTNAA